MSTALPIYSDVALSFTEPVLVNFKEEFEAERVKINTWVAEQTQDKIKDLLVSGVLSADSRMVLINALYFKGEVNVRNCSP